MSVAAAGFRIVFLMTSATSAAGFIYAKTLNKSDGPTKKIADFSTFMAFSFGIYLFSCLGSFFFCAASGEKPLAAMFALLFGLPFALAFVARSYERAQIVFNLQIAGLIAGALALARFGR